MERTKDKIIKYLPIALFATILLARLTYTFTVNYVVGESMYPTLSPRQLVAGSIVPVKLDRLEYKDIVIVKMRDRLIIKRIIATPGQTVEIKDNVLYVDGNIVDESSYAHKVFPNQLENYDKIKLKDDEYFVMGDNRDYSTDSRMIGPVQKSKIVSKVLLPNKK